MIIGIDLNLNVSDLVGEQLVIAEGKTRRGKWNIALPGGNQFFAIGRLTGFLAGGHKFVALWAAKCQVKVGPEGELSHAEFR